MGWKEVIKYVSQEERRYKIDYTCTGGVINDSASTYVVIDSDGISGKAKLSWPIHEMGLFWAISLMIALRFSQKLHRKLLGCTFVLPEPYYGELFSCSLDEPFLTVNFPVTNDIAWTEIVDHKCFKETNTTIQELTFVAPKTDSAIKTVQHIITRPWFAAKENDTALEELKPVYDMQNVSWTDVISKMLHEGYQMAVLGCEIDTFCIDRDGNGYIMPRFVSLHDKFEVTWVVCCILMAIVNFWVTMKRSLR